MAAQHAALAESHTQVVPLASPYEGAVRRRLASAEAKDRRRMSRRAAKAARDIRIRVGSERVEVEADEEKTPADTLTPKEFELLERPLRTVACSSPWVDAILDAMRLRKLGGRRVVPYAISDAGTLRTKVPKLLEMIAAAGVYPPAVDDVPCCRPSDGAYHLGSLMRPCWCRACTTEEGGHFRARLYPAYYTGQRQSWECRMDRSEVDPVVALANPDLADLWNLQNQPVPRVDGHGNPSPRAYEVTETRMVDVDAWRRHKLARLAVKSAAVLRAMRRHRWSETVGDVETARPGRQVGEAATEKSTVRVKRRRMNTIGDLADFVARGHDVHSIDGINASAAADVLAQLDAYPRYPGMVFVTVRHLGTSKVADETSKEVERPILTDGEAARIRRKFGTNTDVAAWLATCPRGSGKRAVG